jgi:hypothetical protein
MIKAVICMFLRDRHSAIYLHDELTRIVSHDSKKHQKILNAGLRLGKKRTAFLSDEKITMLAAEFEKFVEDALLQNYKNMGKIIVSSVIDEKYGDVSNDQ